MNYTKAAEMRIAIFDKFLKEKLITTDMREDLYKIFLGRAERLALDKKDLSKDWPSIFDDMRGLVAFHFDHSEYVWSQLYDIAVKNKKLLFPQVDEFEISLNSVYDKPATMPHDEEPPELTVDKMKHLYHLHQEDIEKVARMMYDEDYDEDDYLYDMDLEEERKAYNGKSLTNLKITDLFNFKLDETGLPSFDSKDIIQFTNNYVILWKTSDHIDAAKKVSRIIFDWVVDDKNLGWSDLLAIAPYFYAGKAKLLRWALILMKEYWLKTHTIDEFLKLLKAQKYEDKDKGEFGYKYNGRMILVTVKNRSYKEPFTAKVGEVVYYLGQRVDENSSNMRKLYFKDDQAYELCPHLGAQGNIEKKIIKYYKEVNSKDEELSKLLNQLG